MTDVSNTILVFGLTKEQLLYISSLFSKVLRAFFLHPKILVAIYMCPDDCVSQSHLIFFLSEAFSNQRRKK